MTNTVEEAFESIREYTEGRLDPRPACGLILGSGMGFLTHVINDCTRIPYERIPGFARTSVEGHSGEMLLGKIAGRSVVALNGRAHVYEGYTLEQIGFPVRVLGRLGCRNLLIGNASGGLNPRMKSGEVMLIDDHLDLMFRPGNFLCCPADSHTKSTTEPSVRGFQKNPFRYSTALQQLLQEIARQNDLTLQTGVYAALTGPNYETRSEYRMLRRLGVDAVGMSTIPEADTAVALGIPVAGLSTITNVACPDLIRSTSHQEVIQAVHSAEQTLRALVLGLIERL